MATESAASPLRAERPVTIVVPAYGQVGALTECIESVLQFGNVGERGPNSLVVINDGGPNADEVERAVLRLFDGSDGAHYFRNEVNLGFVETCNRAVFELDETENDILLLNSDARLTDGALEEMVFVLNATEKHGAVCPRSSNAGLSSLPYRTRAEHPDPSWHSGELHHKISRFLPRFTILPVAMGFCLLTKRELIQNFGLFDSIFSPGYDEENDFCMRINAAGYSSVMANHAYVHHQGSMSFDTQKRSSLQEEHYKILTQRYPFYDEVVRDYLEFRRDPADKFADYLFPKEGQRPKILLDLSSLSTTRDDDSRVALELLERFSHSSQVNLNTAAFTIRADSDVADFWGLAQFGFPVLTDRTPGDDLFDLGFSMAPPTQPRQLHFLNDSCARWIFLHVDVTGLRTFEKLAPSFSRRLIVRDSLRFADGIISTSPISTQDLMSFFSEGSASVEETGIITIALDHSSAFDPLDSEQELGLFATDVCDIVISRAQKPVNIRKLQSRVSYFRSLSLYAQDATAPLQQQLNRRALRLAKQLVDFLYRFMARAFSKSGESGEFVDDYRED